MGWALLLISLSPFALVACTAAPDTAPTQTAQDEVGVSDVNRYVKACMEDAGFVMEYDHQGGLVGEEVPPEQADLLNESLNRCMEESGAWDPYTDEQLNELYDLEVRDYECLIAAGFAPAEPPTRQQYLDDWRGQGTVPYQAWASVGPSNQADAAEACTPARWEFG